MSKKRSLVLVAGIGRGPFEALAPVLDRQKLEVVKVATPEMSVELAQSEPFDLLIFDADVKKGTLEQVVNQIRHEMSESRNTSLLVLARSGRADGVHELIYPAARSQSSAASRPRSRVSRASWILGAVPSTSSVPSAEAAASRSHATSSRSTSST